jgi:hypothetical protein
VAADRDSSGTDTVKISETSTAATADADDIDPDAANYAAGNDPDTAYRNQGRADSPNGWGSQARLDDHQENDDYADGADEHDQSREDRYDTDTPDLWGDTDPDAAIYAPPDSHAAGNPDGRQDSDGQDKPEPSPDADSPSQDQHAEENAEQIASPEQQQFSALKAENASLKQGLADADLKIAELEAKDEAKAAQIKEQAVRLDHIEQLLASRERQPDGIDAPKHTDAALPTAPDQERAPDVATAKYGAEIAGNKVSDQETEAKDAQNTHWRRLASAENVGMASTVVSAADTVAQFAMHATPEGVVGLGAMTLGLVSLGLARIEKKAEDRRKEKGKP